MQDHIAIINDHPAIAREALLFSFFPMFGANVFNGGLGECVQHAVAGAGADNKIVGKRDDVFQIDQDNIFTLFVFQGVYNFTSKFQCVQISPLGLDSGAENNFV
jgi:hypothetical protein